MKELRRNLIRILSGFVIIYIVFITVGCALQQDQADKVINSNNSNSARAIINPASANLAAYWKFDQNVLDYTVNHNDGAITGASSWAEGIAGNSISLSGINNYVTCPDSATLNIQGDITLEAWIKTSAMQDEEIIAKYQGYDGGCNGYALKIQNGKLSLLVGTNWKLSIGSVNDGNWHYVVVTGNGSTGTFFIDGQPSGIFAYSGITNNSGIPLHIGCYQGLGCFTGKLDELAIWNRALTQAEIQWHYNNYPSLHYNTVYVAGFYNNDSKYLSYFPCYWFGTTKINLPSDKGVATSIFVSDKIYTAGSSGTGPCYWSGLIKNDLPGPGGVSSLYVTNGIVYTAGSTQGTGGNTACYWTDKVMTILPSNYNGYATSVYVSENTVYTAGSCFEVDSSYYFPCYWKGKIRTVLPNEWYGVATSIYVSGNTVYTAGYQGSKPCYWINTNRTDLSFPGGGYSARANSLFVSGSTIYTAGYYYDGVKNIPCYWNGTDKTDLPFPGDDSSVNSNGGYVTSIYVYDNTIYTAGCYFDGNKRIPCFWTGKIRTDLPCDNGGSATSIFIK